MSMNVPPDVPPPAPPRDPDERSGFSMVLAAIGIVVVLVGLLFFADGMRDDPPSTAEQPRTEQPRNEPPPAERPAVPAPEAPVKPAPANPAAPPR